MWKSFAPAEWTSPVTQEWDAISLKSDVPLAQTLAWARAAKSMGAECLWVSSTADQASGLVHAPPGEAGTLHCQNGPLLAWEEPKKAIQQFAYFAQTTARDWHALYRQRPHTLRLRPRIPKPFWDTGVFETFPIPYAGVEFASTLRKIIPESDISLQQSFSPRLQRTLRHCFTEELQTDWTAVHAISDLKLYTESLRLFSRRKSFIVPPWEWFESLSQEKQSMLYLAQVRYQGSSARAWIWIQGTEAHFLFGERTGPALPGRMALGAAVQLVALQGARSQGALLYDFNGFQPEAGGLPAYASVSDFKSQFGGDVVDYAIPEFVIEI